MKEYQVRRSHACPTGEHVIHSVTADGQEVEETADCTCPWLMIRDSEPVPHVMAWNRGELDRLIKEFDEGYFDPKDLPPRRTSVFLSPQVQELIRLWEEDRVGLVLRLLVELNVDAVAWSDVEHALLLRVPFARQGEHEWAQLQLPAVAGEPAQVSRSNDEGEAQLLHTVAVGSAGGFDPLLKAELIRQVRLLRRDDVAPSDPTP